MDGLEESMPSKISRKKKNNRWSYLWGEYREAKKHKTNRQTIDMGQTVDMREGLKQGKEEHKGLWDSVVVMEELWDLHMRGEK